MSVSSLKSVELTHEVTDLSTVPFLNFGQEIQSKRNLLRYWAVVNELNTDVIKPTIQNGKGMPLPQNSYVNILVDDPEMDFYSPKFLTYPESGEKVNRFGYDLDQLKLTIESSFVGIIKRIRTELRVEGDKTEIAAKDLSIGADANLMIKLDPRKPADFITTCGAALKLWPDTLKVLGEKNGGTMAKICSYDIDLPYFR